MEAVDDTLPPRLLGPRYWPMWLALGLIRMLEKLPYAGIVRLGQALGTLARWVLPSHVRVVRRNLALCLPERPEAERERILEAHFRSIGVSAIETAMGWWSSDARVLGLSTLEGLEHLDAALARGKGVIVLTAHFATTEASALMLAVRRRIVVLYRPTKNALANRYMVRNRARRVKRVIARDDVRSLVRALRDNDIVWYAPDQAYRGKGAIMVPFFGVPAATNPATTRLAKMTGATVLPYSHERLPGAAGWRAVIHPPLADLTGDDAGADALAYHHFVEEWVRRVPEQYWWLHRRFKGLSPDYPDYYGRGGGTAG
jgi:KDO2-lipid IV(A) lauroyltransferase